MKRYSVEKLARMTPDEANRRLILTPPTGCRNSFSSCNDGTASNDDLHRKDCDGSSPQAGPGGSSPTVLPSRMGGIIGRRWGGSLLDADQQTSARTYEFDCVLVWKFYRFARSKRHLLTALEEFDYHGVRFISVQDQIDTASPMGRAIFTIILDSVVRSKQDLSKFLMSVRYL